MNADQLFVTTFDWIDNAIHREPLDQYELLLTAGRLRLLLLDENTLIEQVNQQRRFQLRFAILRHGDGPPLQELIELWCVPDGLAPSLMAFGHNVPIETVSRSVFLHERIMIYQGEDVSVHDLIRHLAHVAGGVHSRNPATPKEEKLNDLAENILLQGVEAPIRCLRGVAAVVLETLRPVRDAILAGH